jgi:hypothetical protein
LTNGIFAARQSTRTSVADHVLFGSNSSSWISTSYSFAIVKQRYAQGANYGGYIVKINQCKVPSEINDFSAGGTGSAAADFLTIRDEEVLILYRIPAQAISFAGN